MKRIIFLFAIFLSLGLKGRKDMKVDIVSVPKRVVIIDYVNSLWTDPINRAFRSYLDQTNESISFYHFVWSNRLNTSAFMDEIVSWKPDVVFFPDEILYRMMAPYIIKKTGAHISTFFCATTRNEILDYKNQSGVFNDYPSGKIIDFARKAFKVETVAVLGGPFAKDVIDFKIKKNIGDKIKIDGFIETEWISYKRRLEEIEKNYDAVWLLLPFGVLDGEHPVDFNKMNPLIKRLKIPSFGYGGIGSIPRTITIGLVQEKIGQWCATHVYSAVFKGKNPGIVDYKSYDLVVDAEQAIRLGVNITDELAQFLKE